MKCPYCEKDGVKPPKKETAYPYGFCPHCKRKPRATVSFIGGVETVTGYSATSRPRSDRGSVKEKVYKIRLSKNDIADLQNGDKRIVVKTDRNGLTLAVIVIQS